MQLRTFLAKDMKDALGVMRADLGDEAIIISSEKLKDGSICLRAGLEAGIAPAPKPEGPPAREFAPDGAGGLSSLGGFDARYRESLLARLREPKPSQKAPSAPFDRTALLNILRAHRTPDALAETLADRAQNSGIPDMNLALAAGFDASLRLEPMEVGRKGGILLVGPPGAGKTAVAAKLAARNALAGHPVLLAATDLETAGQVARLESLAACFDVAVLSASEPGDLSQALNAARESGAFVVADSAGCDPREPLSREFAGFLAMGGLDIVGVVSATTDAEEAAEIAGALAKLGATRLIVTGLDLTRRKGTLVALALSGMAIAHVTASPFLADGLETLTPLALSRSLTENARPSAPGASA